MDNERVAKELLRLAKVIAAGCEKLPEGAMRDNCEKKKKDKGDSKEAAVAEHLLKIARDLTGGERKAGIPTLDGSTISDLLNASRGLGRDDVWSSALKVDSILTILVQNGEIDSGILKIWKAAVGKFKKSQNEFERVGKRLTAQVTKEAGF